MKRTVESRSKMHKHRFRVRLFSSLSSLVLSLLYLYHSLISLFTIDQKHYLKAALSSLNLSFLHPNLHSQQSIVLQDDSVLGDIFIITDSGVVLWIKTAQINQIFYNTYLQCYHVQTQKCNTVFFSGHSPYFAFNLEYIKYFEFKLRTEHVLWITSSKSFH